MEPSAKRFATGAVLLMLVISAFMWLALNTPSHAQMVAPDPWRGPRDAVCVDFDRSLPELCNVNPARQVYREGTDCRRFVDNGNNTVTILCSEDHPRYYEMIRVAAVARTCGENAVGCIGAFFDREYSSCVLRVIPDHWNPGPYDVRVSDLFYEWRIRLYRQGEGIAFQNYESRHRRQQRYALYNEQHPWRWGDPCR